MAMPSANKSVVDAIQEFIGKINVAAQALSDLGTPITEEDMIFQLQHLHPDLLIYYTSAFTKYSTNFTALSGHLVTILQLAGYDSLTKTLSNVVPAEQPSINNQQLQSTSATTTTASPVTEVANLVNTNNQLRRQLAIVRRGRNNRNSRWNHQHSQNTNNFQRPFQHRFQPRNGRGGRFNRGGGRYSFKNNQWRAQGGRRFQITNFENNNDNTSNNSNYNNGINESNNSNNNNQIYPHFNRLVLNVEIHVLQK